MNYWASWRTKKELLIPWERSVILFGWRHFSFQLAWHLSCYSSPWQQKEGEVSLGFRWKEMNRSRWVKRTVELKTSANWWRRFNPPNWRQNNGWRLKHCQSICVSTDWVGWGKGLPLNSETIHWYIKVPTSFSSELDMDTYGGKTITRHWHVWQKWAFDTVLIVLLWSLWHHQHLSTDKQQLQTAVCIYLII